MDAIKKQGCAESPLLPLAKNLQDKAREQALLDKTDTKAELDLAVKANRIERSIAQSDERLEAIAKEKAALEAEEQTARTKREELQKQLAEVRAARQARFSQAAGLRGAVLSAVGVDSLDQTQPELAKQLEAAFGVLETILTKVKEVAQAQQPEGDSQEATPTTPAGTQPEGDVDMPGPETFDVDTRKRLAEELEKLDNADPMEYAEAVGPIAKRLRASSPDKASG